MISFSLSLGIHGKAYQNWSSFISVAVIRYYDQKQQWRKDFSLQFHVTVHY